MVKKNLILPVDRYMDEALYNHKTGYYMQKNPFGKKGDFITSPNISILFSEMIAIWIIAFWENLKCPRKFNLIELGAGNGEMMNIIIKTFKNFPHFEKSCRINIFEKSNYLKKIQKDKLKHKDIKWLENLDEITNIPNIFIANEFFDALPIKQFVKKKNQWYEKKIQFSKDKNHTLIDEITNIKEIEKKVFFKISYNQEFIEYSPLLIKYINIISKKISLNDGGLLVIDYGNWNKKMKNTIKAIFNHKHGSVLENFGKSDITYNINFGLFKKILEKCHLKVNGNTIQRKFLLNLGILKRAEIISKNLPFSKKTDIYYRIKRLIDERSMGKLFKVILATKKIQILKLDLKIDKIKKII